MDVNHPSYPLISGYVNIAMENGPVEIVDLPIENGGTYHLPSGKPTKNYGTSPLLNGWKITIFNGKINYFNGLFP